MKKNDDGIVKNQKTYKAYGRVKEVGDYEVCEAVLHKENKENPDGAINMACLVTADGHDDPLVVIGLVGSAKLNKPQVQAYVADPKSLSNYFSRNVKKLQRVGQAETSLYAELKVVFGSLCKALVAAKSTCASEGQPVRTNKGTSKRRWGQKEEEEDAEEDKTTKRMGRKSQRKRKKRRTSTVHFEKLSEDEEGEDEETRRGGGGRDGRGKRDSRRNEYAIDEDKRKDKDECTPAAELDQMYMDGDDENAPTNTTRYLRHSICTLSI